MNKLEKVSIVLFCILMAVAGFGMAYYLKHFHDKSPTENAIEFCGCSDKSCILMYVNGDFNKFDYNKRCK